MSKFAVGEIAAHIGEHDGTCRGWKPGEHCEVVAVRRIVYGDYVPERNAHHFGDPCDYLVVSLVDGCLTGVDEGELRKLPPDATEDPSLTRIKKLLEQDSINHKQPVKA